MVAANASDFFGEGIYDDPEAQKAKRDWTANPPQTNAELQQYLQQVQGDLYTAPGTDSTPGSSEERAVNAYQGGNFGATAGYAAGNDATRAAYGKAHATTQAVGIGRLPGEIANYFGNAQVNLNPFDGAPQNVKDAANAQLATDAYAHRNDPVPTNPATVIGADVVPTGPGVPAPPAPAPGATGATNPAAGTTGAPGSTGTSQAVSDLLGGVTSYQGQIAALAGDNTGLSVAEAQLKKASDLANMQAGIATQNSQSAALGMARSARNRGDRALLERQAVGEAGYIGQKAAYEEALRRVALEGDLGVVRATEDKNDRDFKLAALKAAGELGLNSAALGIDLNRVNMADATERMKIALGYSELDQTKARDLMAYTRDMASIQYKYDELSVTDQNEADKLLMQKYNIDQDTMLKLKELRQKTKVDWNGLLTKFAAGAGKGLTAGLANASDERVKTNIQPVDATAQEFEDFLGALSANTYEYKEPDKHGAGLRFGLMAQDLEKTKLGRHMVKPIDGVKMVDIGPLALGTASGLALVYERLRELEKAVRS
jgi:hypothetical protein